MNSSHGKPIVLIGFMATGKSTVGRLVAERTGRRFFDLDRTIEEDSGHVIADIFRSEGETGFRRWERESLLKLLRERDAVVATGGGAACQAQNLDDMLAQGLVVALAAPVDEVIRRAGDRSGRPLLDGSPAPRELAVGLLREREPFYQRAHVRVETAGRSPEQVAEDVVAVMTGNKEN